MTAVTGTTAQQPPTRNPILEVRNITKRFGGLTALEDVSFQLFPGEVLALAGDNGAGKSTLIKCISGAHHPSEGQILFEGQPVSISTPHESRVLGIETIYQDLALAENLDVGSNVFLGRERMRKIMGIFPALDRVSMFPLIANEALISTRLSGVNSAEGFAAMIPQGKRAVSVPITDATGAGGMVQPR